MQRRVEQPDGHRQPVHGLEELDEVVALQRHQRRQGRLARLGVVGEDQALDQDAAVAEEHVLGAAQPDALRAEAPGPGGVLGGVGVGPHPQPPGRVGVAEEPVARPAPGRRSPRPRRRRPRRALPPGSARPVSSRRHVAEEHLAGRAVDGDHVALGHTTSPSGAATRAVRARRRRRAPPPRTRTCVPMPRATTAAWTVLPPRLVSTPAAAIMPSQVVGVGLPAHQDHLLARGVPRRPRWRSRTPPRPTPRPATPPCPGPAGSASAPRSNCGNISRASCSPVTRASASSSVISSSSTSCAAIRNAARGGPLARPASAASTACRARR